MMSSIRYFESINEEFLNLQNRVRNLITDAHWGEDGRHKEAIIKNIIQKFLPRDFIIKTGFIFYSDKKCSTQIDIMIITKDCAPLFQEGEFVIVTPDCVRAIIEVKTRTNLSTLSKDINKLNIIGKELSEIIGGKEIFIGLFSYEFKNTRNNNIELNDSNRTKLINSGNKLYKDFFLTRENRQRNKRYFCSNIVLNSDLLIRQVDYPFSSTQFGIYSIENLAHYYFIANLLEILSPNITQFKNIWFPLQKKLICDFDPFDKS